MYGIVTLQNRSVSQNQSPSDIGSRGGVALMFGFAIRFYTYAMAICCARLATRARAPILQAWALILFSRHLFARTDATPPQPQRNRDLRDSCREQPGLVLYPTRNNLRVHSPHALDRLLLRAACCTSLHSSQSAHFGHRCARLQKRALAAA